MGSNKKGGSMTKEKSVEKGNALQQLSARLSVDPNKLQSTLMSTVIKDIKQKNGSYRKATEAEILVFIAVANTYRLNPLTKEIYAYPDTKGAGIVPIVSTDGWNKLMTKHPDYKTHYYKYAEEREQMKGAKSCPEWCEIHIVKKDESEVVVREYLDECFRDLDYTNPWRTHTKRMLRHKTKIQGAREAFGFGGIYDEDEGERIIEGQIIEVEAKTKRPPLQEPRAITSEQKEEKEITPETESEQITEQEEKKKFIEKFNKAKAELDEDCLKEILKTHGLRNFKEIKSLAVAEKVLESMEEVIFGSEKLGEGLGDSEDMDLNA